jgi:hypothetical protein
MICITFDNFGCGSQLPPCPFPDIIPAEEWSRYNEIGLTLGHPRILHLLGRLKLQTTYFAEGYSAILHPVEMRRWRDAGHEIALHGWKHEMWTSLPSRQREHEVVALAVAAVKDLLGEAPLGFRPPGMRINSWTDDVLEAHGIQYVCQILEREQDQAARFAKLGIAYARGPEKILKSRLKILRCSDRLIDGDLINTRDGGFFGELSAAEAYARFFQMAIEHHHQTPNEPWVFIVHPHISGSRAWVAFEDFLERLHSEFGPGSFKQAHEVALKSGIAGATGQP